MKILFVASEFTPFAKVGGLGDVIGSLPRALAKLGNNVSVIIPRYEQINLKKIGAEIVVKKFPVRVGKNKEYINLYKKTLAYGVKLYLVENKKYLSLGPVYFEHTAFVGSFREIQRFLFFSQAVYSLLDKSPLLSADIVHCNDWHTGALVTMLKGRWSRVKGQAVFTIHNLANQGTWNAKEVATWFNKQKSPAYPPKPPRRKEIIKELPFKLRGANFNFMADGIENAGVVTTVSETYAKEIQTRQYGAGLRGLLKKRARKGKLAGILNGIDYSYWPAAKRDKRKFQRELGLKADSRSPIFGMVARLTYQKGVNIITPIIPRLIKEYGAQFVFLGQGETKNEKALRGLAKKFPKNVFAKIGFNEKLARKIYAQSDFFLMPSLFEPSGLGQMIAMRYGTVPIVRATGGLKDSVVNKKTGFVFKNSSSKSLSEAMEEALKYYAHPVKSEALYGTSPKKLKAIIKNCKKQDFSWNKSAKKYLKVYEDAAA